MAEQKAAESQITICEWQTQVTKQPATQQKVEVKTEDWAKADQAGKLGILLGAVEDMHQKLNKQITDIIADVVEIKEPQQKKAKVEA